MCHLTVRVAWTQLLHPKPYQVTCPQLAVDGQVEQSKVPDTVGDLETLSRPTTSPKAAPRPNALRALLLSGSESLRRAIGRPLGELSVLSRNRSC
jgi:hypothetical protein